MKNSDTSRELTLKDIAFDVNKKSGYTVYIEEDSKFVPYLVLTSNYNGHALLLRKEVLNEYYTFNDGLGYYGDSFIDRFLNNDFIAILDPEIQNTVVDTEITITAESSLGITGTDTENITRKVFLLSCSELGITGSSVANEEGNKLKYFKDSNSRIAYKNKEECSWWLRTSYTWYSNSAWGIGPDGSSGGGGVSNINGIRPAFCLKNTQLIEKSNEIINGQTVYVITK